MWHAAMTAMTALVLDGKRCLTAEFGGETCKGLVVSFLAFSRAVENFQTWRLSRSCFGFFFRALLGVLSGSFCFTYVVNNG